MGLTSRMKSICRVAAGGNLLGSISAAHRLKAWVNRRAIAHLGALASRRRVIEPNTPAGRRGSQARLEAAVWGRRLVFMMAGLVPQSDIHVGSMNGGVATRRPAGAHSHLHELGMVDVPNKDLARGHVRSLDLRMATKAQVGVPLGEQLGVHRTVDGMTNGATFAQGGMLEDKGTSLLAMAFRAGLVGPGQLQPTRRFEDVASVRVMALNAAHFVFQHRMMLRQMKFGFNGPMTLEAGGWVFARVDDEFAAPAAAGHVEAAGSVTRFTAGLAGCLDILQVNARMWACGKFPGDVGVALRTGFVADETCAGNFGSGGEGQRLGGARIQKCHTCNCKQY